MCRCHRVTLQRQAWRGLSMGWGPSWAAWRPSSPWPTNALLTRQTLRMWTVSGSLLTHQCQLLNDRFASHTYKLATKPNHLVGTRAMAEWLPVVQNTSVHQGLELSRTWLLAAGDNSNCCRDCSVQVQVVRSMSPKLSLCWAGLLCPHHAMPCCGAGAEQQQGCC